MDVETVSERMHREEVESLKKRIAALEAEKAERERQEPVAVVSKHTGGFGPDYLFITSLGNLAKLTYEGAKLYAHPLTLREPTEDECRRIADRFLCEVANAARGVRTGRAMFNAVREVMKK